MVKDSKSKSGNGKTQKTWSLGRAARTTRTRPYGLYTLAAGLTEEAEANSGHTAEEIASLAGLPLAAAPAEGEDERDLLAALLAAQADPAIESVDVQQVVAEQAAPQDGAEIAAPVLEQVRLTEQEQIDLRNSVYEAETKRHAVEAERAKQVE